MEVEHYTISAVARLIGAKPSALSWHIGKGKVAQPSHVWNRRAYYSAADVEVIRAYWAARVPAGCSRFTAEDVAEMHRLWVGGITQADIAVRFGTFQTHVSQLLTGSVLPGWKGGAIGHGRKRRKVKRRRNVSLGCRTLAPKEVK